MLFYYLRCYILANHINIFNQINEVRGTEVEEVDSIPPSFFPPLWFSQFYQPTLHLPSCQLSKLPPTTVLIRIAQACRPAHLRRHLRHRILRKCW